MTSVTPNSELLKFRRLAHEAFDPLWIRLVEGGKTHKQAKGMAYAWLQRVTGFSAAECHMSEMSIEQCRKVIAVCQLVQM